MNLTSLPSPYSKLEGDARASRAEQAETPDWKALTMLIMKRAEASINPTGGVSASSAQVTLATATTMVADAANVEVNGSDVVMSADGAIELVEQQIAFQACAPALTSCENDGRGKPQIDMSEKEAILEEWAGLSNLEEINDLEELAHNLRHSVLAPDSHPRIEALFRRAASGKGYHSQLIRASGLI